MAEFLPCFEKVIELEGGYKLHEVFGDRGGMTYAGISRVHWPDWEGWTRVDAGTFDDVLKDMVKAFYKKEFWDKLMGDIIGSQKMAFALFDFAVNAGLKTSVKLCQKIVGVEQDGVFGPMTLKALSAFAGNGELFVAKFGLERVFMYKDISLSDKRRKQDKVVSNLRFLEGWINRVQAGLK